MRHDAVRADFAQRIATIGAGPAGKEAAQEHQLDVAHPVRALGAEIGAVRRGLQRVAVVLAGKAARWSVRAARVSFRPSGR